MPRDLLADIAPVKRQPRDLLANIGQKPEGMTMAGFGKNIVSDIGANVRGVADITNKALAYIPKQGAAIGKDIAKTFMEQKSVIDPYRRYKEVGKKIIEPIRHPVQAAERALTPANEMSKALLQQTGQMVRHPIKTAYEQPVTTAMMIAPVVPKAIKGAKKLIATQGSKALTNKAASLYRQILNPGKGEIKKIVVKGHKNIDDYYKLAAKDALPIERSAEGKLLTEKARSIVNEKITQIHDKINPLLANSKATYNLKEIANKAKVSLSKRFKNASELKTAIAEVDKYIDAEIERLGGEVATAQQLNNIKQGMWSVGFDGLAPTSKESARIVGHVMKDALEKGITEGSIKSLNKLSGDYLTLKTLLENAEGRVIRGGMLGNIFARSTGAAVGGIVGSTIPIPGVSTAGGGMIGYKVGDVLNKFATDPARLSGKASKLMRKASQAKRYEDLFNKLKLKGYPIDKGK